MIRKDVGTGFIVAMVFIVTLFMGIPCASTEWDPMNSCTGVLVGKDASADGSVLLSHNEDMGSGESGKLWFQPRKTHAPGETLYTSYVTIPQVPITYAYWGHGNSDQIALEDYDGSILDGMCDGSILDGMNEFGVSVGCNAQKSREELIPKGEGILRYGVRQIIMERARSAREAVELIGWLVDTYGSSGMVGAYLLGDPYEAWLVETTPRHWVARRIPDDGFHALANQYTIETEWDLASDDLIDYAVARGWYDPASKKLFNFKYVYGDGLDAASNVVRELHSRAMLAPKVGSITKEDLMEVTRTHYEETSDYYYPPHDRSVRRPICTHNCQAALVWQLRRDVPLEFGGAVMWYAPSTACTSAFVPIYISSTRIPEKYLIAGKEYDPVSAWWAFDMLQRLVDKRYAALHPEVRKRLDEFEQKEFAETVQLEQEALILYERGETQKARDLLAEYTYTRLNDAVREARMLLQWAATSVGVKHEDLLSTF